MPDNWGDTRMSFGIGVFSGNDPTVWFSNAYQNFGGALGRATATGSAGCDGTELNVLAGGGFSGIPDCVLDAAQLAGTGDTAGVPLTLLIRILNFQTYLRYSFGVEHNTASDWNIRGDLIYSDMRDQVAFVDLIS